MTSAKRLFSGTNITCIRGRRLLFQKLSFGMNPGDVVHLSGPNGVGKTSLLRIMCGALPAAKGDIEWDGKDFLENGLSAHAHRLAFLPSDDRSLKPLETALENLQFWAGVWSLDKKDCPGALNRMQIGDLKDTPVRHLSAGQKRRLSLARVFLKKAPLWLLDEPLNGLDRDSYDLFIKAINVHCAIGGMVAVASHYTIEPPKHGRLQRIDVGMEA
jgi:heme exporter protein A